MRIYLLAALCILPLTMHSAPVGLPNQGNSCYMNSLLQALLNVPELTMLAQKNFGASETAKLFYGIAFNRKKVGLDEALRAFYRHLDTQFELASLERILSELGRAKTVADRKKILKKYAQSETARTEDLDVELQDTELPYERRADLENRKERAQQTVRILETIEELLESPDIPIKSYYSLITLAREEEGDLGYRQQDAEEFYSLFMNSLKIPAIEILFNLTEQRLINGKSSAATTTNRLALQLYAKAGGPYFRSIQEALNYYCATITLDKDYSIPFAKSRYVFKNLPQILVIQTPRYEQDDYGRRKRISPTVAVSDPLIFTRAEHGINARYSPEALVVQSGSLSGGHYVAYVKSYEDGLWYFCNDSSITKLGKQLVSDKYYPYEPNTYLIFYRRIDDPAATAAQELAESLWKLSEALA